MAWLDSSYYHDLILTPTLRLNNTYRSDALCCRFMRPVCDITVNIWRHTRAAKQSTGPPLTIFWNTASFRLESESHVKCFLGNPYMPGMKDEIMISLTTGQLDADTKAVIRWMPQLRRTSHNRYFVTDRGCCRRTHNQRKPEASSDPLGSPRVSQSGSGVHSVRDSTTGTVKAGMYRCSA